MSGPHRPTSPELSTGTLAQLACLLEVSAPKPGNVQPGQEFEDTSWLDFALAAAVVGPLFDEASRKPLGDTVLEAVSASRRVAGRNVNLGVILLLAPLAAVPPHEDSRVGVERVLAGLTPTDSKKVYMAIRLAAPGGLGTVHEDDVRGEAPDDLVKAMARAADRDLVARQYATGFEDLFEDALPAFERARADGLSLEQCIVRLHLHLMSAHPDSLIARKCGREVAQEAADRARQVLLDGWPHRDEATHAFETLDAWLRADGNRRNPGTTADMVAAALFLALRAGIIHPGALGNWRKPQA